MIPVPALPMSAAAAEDLRLMKALDAVKVDALSRRIIVAAATSDMFAERAVSLTWARRMELPDGRKLGDFLPSGESLALTTITEALERATKKETER